MTTASERLVVEPTIVWQSNISLGPALTLPTRPLRGCTHNPPRFVSKGARHGPCSGCTHNPPRFVSKGAKDAKAPAAGARIIPHVSSPKVQRTQRPHPTAGAVPCAGPKEMFDRFQKRLGRYHRAGPNPAYTAPAADACFGYLRSDACFGYMQLGTRVSAREDNIRCVPTTR